MAETENPVIEAGQFFGDDGAFSANWREQAFGETDPMRTNPTLKNIKDIRTMAHQVVSGESTIGKLSGGREFAILPTEQSDETEINAFRTKIGRPDAPEGYELSKTEIPEGLPKDENYITHMAKGMFDLGVPKAMAAGVAKLHVDYLKQLNDGVQTQDKLDMQEANKEIRTKFGAAYDNKMLKAIAAARVLGGPIDAGAAEEMVKELPYDSFAAQLFAAMGDIIGEKNLEEVPGAKDGVMTPADAMSEYNKLTKDPYYLTASPPDKPKNQQYHDEIIQKGAKLLVLAKKR